MFPNFRHARVLEVMKIEVNEGDGRDIPVRRVAYLVSLRDGQVIAKVDGFAPIQFEIEPGTDEMIKL